MIVFESVSLAASGRTILHEIDLAVDAGELCVLVGPSGAGKSTLLRLVNAMAAPTSGRVRVRGKDVRAYDPVALRRSIGYVIQSIGLFPHRTVAQNVATAPRLLGWPAARIEARVRDMLALVHLDPDLFAHRRPAGLSGGQAQRVGLARALAADPDILLMDEPFGAVDPVTRRALREELRRIHRETGKTVLFVTHDPMEALELATTLVVLKEGRVVAAGDPARMVRESEGFVADLLGPDRCLRILAGSRVGDRASPGPPERSAPSVPANATLLDALSAMLTARTGLLAVEEEDGRISGRIAIADIVEDRP